MAVVSNPNSYITRRELSQSLSNYVEKSFVLEYIHTELEDSLDNLNVCTKDEISSTLENYITKTEVQDILKNNNEYYNKQETRSLINSAINSVKNIDLPNKLFNYVLKTDLTDSIYSLTYSKTEIDTMLTDYVKSTSADNELETYINNALLGYAKLDDVKNTIMSSINASSRQLEAKVNTVLNSYVSKESINDALNKIKESTYLLENTLADYYTKDELNNRVNFLIKNYCYTREETRQLIQVSMDFFKNNYLESRLDDFVTKEAYADHIINYYNKDEVDEKLEGENFCNIKYVTYSEYKSLKRRYQIYDNYIYVVSNFGRIMYLYIGSMLLAKRDTEGSFGFPYTFPITF